MFPKTRVYIKSYDNQTKWTYFLIKSDDLFQKYNTILDNASADIKEELDSEPVYNKKFLKTKIKSIGDEVTYFHDKEIPKVVYNFTSLAVISLECALKEDENYYPQVLSKEQKYFEKEKQVVRNITEDIGSLSSDSDEEQIKTKHQNLFFYKFLSWLLFSLCIMKT